MDGDWVEEAKRIFAVNRPVHFTDYRHCQECAEHDETLRNASLENIGLEELGNPGWDPLCFCSAVGLQYYLPALVRLSLETVGDDFYFAQMLFHLEYGGKENRLLCSCTAIQRRFITAFLAHMISTYPGELEESMCADDALRAYKLWSNS